MNKQATVDNLIRVSYSVPNGNQLRKACYQYRSLTSRKASLDEVLNFAQYIGEGAANLVGGAVVGMTLLLAVVLDVFVSLLNSLLDSEATKYLKDMFNDDGIESIKKNILNGSLVTKGKAFADVAFKKFVATYDYTSDAVSQFGLDVSKKYDAISGMVGRGYDSMSGALGSAKESLVSEYKELSAFFSRLDLFNLIKQTGNAIKEGGEKAYAAVFAFFKSYQTAFTTWFHDHVSPHATTQNGILIAVGTALLIGIYYNRNALKEYLKKQLTKFKDYLPEIAKGLSEMSSSVANYFKKKLSGFARTATIDAAYLTGDPRAIRLALTL